MADQFSSPSIHLSEKIPAQIPDSSAALQIAPERAWLACGGKLTEHAWTQIIQSSSRFGTQSSQWKLQSDASDDDWSSKSSMATSETSSLSDIRHLGMASNGRTNFEPAQLLFGKGWFQVAKGSSLKRNCIYIYIYEEEPHDPNSMDFSSCKSIEYIFTFCCCTKRIICETFRFVPTLILILCLCALLASFSANYYVEVLCSVNRFPPWRWQSSELFHEQNKSLCLAVEYQYGGKMLQHRWAKRKYRWVYQNHIYIYYMYYTAMCVNIIGQTADSCLFVNHCVWKSCGTTSFRFSMGQ